MYRLASEYILRAARGLCLALVMASCGDQGASQEPLPPNILLISVDSLRADHLGCYGYGRNTSPNIDALAERGVVFEQAVSQAPWTLPSHASLFTSLYGRTHQTNDKSSQLPKGTPTLAGSLGAAGFNTAGIVSGTFMQKRFGLDAGFQSYDDELARVTHVQSHEALTSEAIHAKAEEVLDGLREPFMLFVHYWDVHYDYSPPAPFDRAFDPDYTGSMTSKHFFKNPAIHPEMAPEDLHHLIALYDGEIATVDAYVGKLLDKLHSEGLEQRTIVLLTADHGDEFFEHGSKGHSHSLYEELIHVPLVISGPGIPARRRVPQPVELIDVMPTLLDLVQVPLPPGLHGRSLTGSFSAGGLEARPVFSETTRARKHKTDAWSEAWMVRDGMNKMILFDASGTSPELYALGQDPGEKHNRLDPARAEEWMAMHRAWIERTPLGIGSQNAGLDSKTLRDLEGLGYLGDQ